MHPWGGGGCRGAAPAAAVGADEPSPARPTTRPECMNRVAHSVTVARRDSVFADSSSREQVDQALRLVDNAGLRFWGQCGYYSRRRTALDSFLQYHIERHFPGED